MKTIQFSRAIVVAGVFLVVIASSSANAKLYEEKKILQIGLAVPLPEVREQCVKWVKGIPNLDYAWTHKTHSECIAHAWQSRTRQWAAYLRVEGPSNLKKDVENAVNGAVATCTAVSVNSAKTTFTGTPAEFAGKTAAATAAALSAFQICMKGAVGISTGIAAAFKVEVVGREFWGKWG